MRIESIFNSDGFCTAYCVWSPRDEKGVEDYDGDYVCVDEMWIHSSLKGFKVIRYFIKEIIQRYPKCKYGYWLRRKYGGRNKMFSVRQLQKEI